VSNLPILHQKWSCNVLWLLVAIYEGVNHVLVSLTQCALLTGAHVSEMWDEIWASKEAKSKHHSKKTQEPLKVWNICTCIWTIKKESVVWSGRGVVTLAIVNNVVITFRSWSYGDSEYMCPFSYLIQLLMWLTLKVLNMLIITYLVHKNLLMKPERFYVIIFDAVYASLTLSFLLSTLADRN